MSRRPYDLPHADARPRIHIWMAPPGAHWARHPTGPRTSALSIGDALEAALDEVEHRSAVIIFEGRQ